jgi:hypothetical protein
MDDVASSVIKALERASGEGLAGYSSMDGQQQGVLVGDARRAIEEAWAIVGGDDDDDDERPEVAQARRASIGPSADGRGARCDPRLARGSARGA